MILMVAVDVSNSHDTHINSNLDTEDVDSDIFSLVDIDDSNKQ